MPFSIMLARLLTCMSISAPSFIRSNINLITVFTSAKKQSTLYIGISKTGPTDVGIGTSATAVAICSPMFLHCSTIPSISLSILPQQSDIYLAPSDLAYTEASAVFMPLKNRFISDNAVRYCFIDSSQSVLIFFAKSSHIAPTYSN